MLDDTFAKVISSISAFGNESIRSAVDRKLVSKKKKAQTKRNLSYSLLSWVTFV